MSSTQADDGTNDAPALAAADIGLIIGTGTDTALIAPMPCA